MTEKVCYAVANASMDELMASSSGGAFSIIARSVLEEGGVVYGHAFVGPTEVRCVRVDDPAGLPRLRGSKYVQSDMGTAMRDVLSDLRAGRRVVFSGTPCQVSGLSSFLRVKGAPTDGLLLIDIVCHGVPSQAFFDACMGWEHRGSRLESVRFRDKREGWGTVGVATAVITTPVFHRSVVRDEVFSPETSYYYERFLAGDVYRESCYRCPYAGGERPGDVTIGDFWGVDQQAAGLDPRGGISLVITNTARGDAVVRDIKEASRWAERPLGEAVAGNDQLRHPTQRPAARDEILEEWVESGIDGLEEEYRRATAWRRRAWLAKRAAKKMLKGAIRR